jgi:hypothetical protein
LNGDKDSFFVDATPKKALPKARACGSRDSERKSSLSDLGHHLQHESPLVAEGAARSIEKARKNRKKNPFPAESIELDVQRKQDWQKRNLSQPVSSLTAKELRKRLTACGIGITGMKKPALLARCLTKFFH